MKKSILFLAAFLMALAVFESCKKTDAEQDQDVATSEDIAITEDLVQQIDMDVEEAVEERGGGGSCPSITTEQPWGIWPNTITIDYGDACTRPDGRVVKGKIVVVQTGEMRQAGTQRTLSFDNFFVDDVHIEGSKVWTNNGLDDNGDFSYTKTANMTHTYPDNSTVTWTHNHTSTLIEGVGTVAVLDNVWSTVGSTTGTNRNGVAFSSTITEPLIKKGLCRWISEGVIVFTRGDRTASLDYGNGDCDRFGTLTLNNGDVISIRLRR